MLSKKSTVKEIQIIMQNIKKCNTGKFYLKIQVFRSWSNQSPEPKLSDDRNLHFKTQAFRVGQIKIFLSKKIDAMVKVHLQGGPEAWNPGAGLPVFYTPQFSLDYPAWELFFFFSISLFSLLRAPTPLQPPPQPQPPTPTP